MQLAVALSTLDTRHLPETPDGSQLSSYVWDLQNPNKPEHVLTPASLIVSLYFSPKDSKVYLT